MQAARTIPLALAVVLAADGAIALLDPRFPTVGFLDEPAHVATGIVVIAALAPRSLGWPVAFWLGAVGIDLDHLALLFGSEAISAGTGRPYSHSLLTVGTVALLAFAVPRARAPALAFSAGILTHLSRDLATGGGVALLWPASYERLTVPYAVWFACLLLLAGWALRHAPRRAESPRSLREGRG